MKRFMYALKLFWLAIRRPDLFQYDLFKIVEGMMDFLKTTAEKERPMSSEFCIKPIAKINFEGKSLLTLWCGYAEKDNPLARLRELAIENERLRSMLPSNTPLTESNEKIQNR